VVPGAGKAYSIQLQLAGARSTRFCTMSHFTIFCILAAWLGHGQTEGLTPLFPMPAGKEEINKTGVRVGNNGVGREVGLAPLPPSYFLRLISSIVQT